MHGESYLIVEQRPGLDEPIETFVGGLGQGDPVDAFTARQRLIGRGLSLLACGSAPTLDSLLLKLNRQGIEGWRIEPRPPALIPLKLQSIQPTEETLHFDLGSSRLSLPRGARAIGVLADLSGSVAEKSLKRLMARKIYQGTDAVAPLEDEELKQAILRAKPVFDLYVFTEEGALAGALRAFAGRFDHRGLGERATLSAVANLGALVDLVGEYASPFLLRTEFGMANLPGCRLPGEETTVGRERLALEALTRFGSLVVQLNQAGLGEPPSQIDPLPRPVFAGLAATQPEPAAASLVLNQALELDALDEPPRTREPAGSTPSALPPPPAIDGGGEISRPPVLQILSGAAGFAFFLSSLFWGEDWFLPALWHYGIRPGILPGLLSLGLFLAAFYYLALKRRIENTPTSKVRSLAMGLVELHGRAIRLYALVSPVTQLPCVYYRLRRYRRTRNSQWQLSSEDCSGPVPFLLEDETGRVRIDPRGAGFRIRSREVGMGGEGNILLGFSGAVNSDEKWVEEVIPEGSSIYLMGFADTRRDGAFDRRRSLAEKLRDLKADRRAMARFDTDGDGVISPEEWDQARRTIEDQVLAETLASSRRRKKQQEQIIVRRPTSRRMPFIIAETESETRMTRGFAWLIPCLFCAAMLAAGWTLYMLLSLFS